MPSIMEDLVKGHEVWEDETGLNVTRCYYIGGCDPNTSALLQAYSVTGLPHFSQPDRDFPNVYCSEMKLTPFAGNSKTQANAVARFKTADFSNAETPIIRFSACARETLSDFDLNGKPLLIRYFPGSGNLAMQTYVPQRRDAKRLGVLEIERVENEIPRASLDYIGRISGSTWQGQAKHTWYCRNVAFEKRLYFAGYRVFYEMEYDPDLHIDTLAFRSAYDGRVPADVPDVDKTLAEANFNALNLPNVFG